MTTATVFGKRGATSPTTEPGGNDSVVQVTVHVTLRGSAANIATDFTTLTGTNWASSTAEITWQKS